ncbi:MAG: hypothetical protein M1828_007393 [Chrysothrix sp. TS-e1954]|nr:MAG: hypothetical protein M1828_007393 [Chrysothrix sp. TS-e1954]
MSNIAEGSEKMPWKGIRWRGARKHKLALINRDCPDLPNTKPVELSRLLDADDLMQHEEGFLLSRAADMGNNCPDFDAGLFVDPNRELVPRRSSSAATTASINVYDILPGSTRPHSSAGAILRSEAHEHSAEQQMQSKSDLRATSDQHLSDISTHKDHDNGLARIHDKAVKAQPEPSLAHSTPPDKRVSNAPVAGEQRQEPHLHLNTSTKRSHKAVNGSARSGNRVKVSRGMLRPKANTKKKRKLPVNELTLIPTAYSVSHDHVRRCQISISFHIAELF